MKIIILLMFAIFISSCKTTPVEPTPTPISKTPANSLQIITLLPEPPAPVFEDGLAAYIPPSPAIKGFLDGKYFKLLDDMVYIMGTTTTSITVPKGFVTDFASVPTALGSFGLTPHGRQSRAAVIHDYLYWTQGCTREQADNIMLIAMQESDVDTLKKFALYKGVDIFGNSSWKNNSRDRKKGHIRLIPEEYFEVPDTDEYKDYNKSLMDKKVKEATFPDDLEYCKFGDSTKVPTGDVISD